MDCNKKYTDKLLFPFLAESSKPRTLFLGEARAVLGGRSRCRGTQLRLRAPPVIAAITPSRARHNSSQTSAVLSRPTHTYTADASHYINRRLPLLDRSSLTSVLPPLTPSPTSPGNHFRHRAPPLNAPAAIRFAKASEPRLFHTQKVKPESMHFVTVPLRYGVVPGRSAQPIPPF